MTDYSAENNYNSKFSNKNPYTENSVYDSKFPGFFDKKKDKQTRSTYTNQLNRDFSDRDYDPEEDPNPDDNISSFYKPNDVFDMKNSMKKTYSAAPGVEYPMNNPAAAQVIYPKTMPIQTTEFKQPTPTPTPSPMTTESSYTLFNRPKNRGDDVRQIWDNFQFVISLFPKHIVEEYYGKNQKEIENYIQQSRSIKGVFLSRQNNPIKNLFDEFNENVLSPAKETLDKHSTFLTNRITRRQTYTIKNKKPLPDLSKQIQEEEEQEEEKIEQLKNLLREFHLYEYDALKKPRQRYNPDTIDFFKQQFAFVCSTGIICKDQMPPRKDVQQELEENEDLIYVGGKTRRHRRRRRHCRHRRQRLTTSTKKTKTSKRKTKKTNRTRL
jgi:hypothetical protein